MFFDPFGDFGEVFVFLADVVFFAEVDEVDDWFGGEEEEGVDYFHLVRSSVGWPYICMLVCVCDRVGLSELDFISR